MRITAFIAAIFFTAVVAELAIAQPESPWFKKVGVVSYTYRNSFSKDVALTLDTIKGLGIKDIEFSNLFGKTAQEIRSMLDSRGMTCSSFGVGYADLVSKTEEVAKNATTLGARYVRVAWIPHEAPFTIEHVRKAIADFNTAGQILKEKFDISFCYHNHGYEFQPFEKGTLFDVMVKETDPKFVNFELDIFWAIHPGADPATLLKVYGPRFKLMHVKDLKKGVRGDFSGKTDVRNDVVLGTGQVNFRDLIKALPKSAIEHLYIEDESPGASRQVPISLDFLRKSLN
jgi:sugar phosphate isomerase/epimerase